MDTNQNQDPQAPTAPSVSGEEASPVIPPLPLEQSQPTPTPITPLPVTPPPASFPLQTPFTPSQPQIIQDKAPPVGKGIPKILLYAVVVIVVVITLVALSMIFISFTKPQQPESKKEAPVKQVNLPLPTIYLAPQDSDTQALSTQGTSDEVSDIEKDLKDTNFSNIDKETSSISSALGTP